MSLFVLVLFGLLALYDFPALLREEKRAEAGILLFFYLSALALVLLLVNGITLPSPAKGIQHVIVDILKIGYPKP